MDNPINIVSQPGTITELSTISENSRLSTGSNILDQLLKGGYEKSIVTTIYGPSASGKTCMGMMAAIETVKAGKKVIYVDTEGSFSIDRAIQLYPQFPEKSDYFIFFKPTSFIQQKDVFNKLKTLTNALADSIGLIVVDSIAMFYRLEGALNSDYSEVNREMSQQLAYLIEIARTKNIPIILTNQVYSNFDNKNEVNMIGGDLIKYTSKCIIELKKNHKLRSAIIKRHRSLPEGLYINFNIEENGIYEGIRINSSIETKAL